MIKRKISINDHEWTIKFYSTSKSYENVQTIESFRDTYGVTMYKPKTITINLEAIKRDGNGLLHVVMHEIGHAWQDGLPAHTGWQSTSNVCADSFGHSVFYIDKVKKLLEGIKC